MSFGDHLEELRRRLILAIVVPLPLLVLCMVFGDHLVGLLIRPLEEQLAAAGQPVRLISTAPAEGFAVWFKVCVFVTLLFSGPWILYQLWLFVKPGLYHHERRFAYLLFPLSALLTVAGAFFLYYLLLPLSLQFLILFGSGLAPTTTPTAPLPPGVVLPQAPSLSADPVTAEPGQFWFNPERHELRLAVPDGQGGVAVFSAPMSSGGIVEQQYRLAEYFDLFLNLGLGFALAFQLPVVLMLLGWTGLVDRAWFGQKRRYVLFGIVVASAVITPPDPWSLFVLAIPLYGLFELGLLLMRFVPAGRVAGKTRWGRSPDAPTSAGARKMNGHDAGAGSADGAAPAHAANSPRPAQPLLAPPAAGSPRLFGSPIDEGDDEPAQDAPAKRDGAEEADP